jgi:hypothetical protein
VSANAGKHRNQVPKVDPDNEIRSIASAFAAALQPLTNISVLRQSGEKLANCRPPDRGVAAHDRQMAVRIEWWEVNESGDGGGFASTR